MQWPASVLTVSPRPNSVQVALNFSAGPWLSDSVSVSRSSDFNKNPAKNHTLCIWSSSLFWTILWAMSDHSSLPSAGILWGQFNQNFPLTLIFPLGFFSPLIPTLLLAYELPLAHAVLGVTSNLSCPGQDRMQWSLYWAWCSSLGQLFLVLL